MGTSDLGFSNPASGTLIVDAAGGSRIFSESVRKAVYTRDTAEKLMSNILCHAAGLKLR